MINNITISKLLDSWDQSSDSSIGVCLRKRRHYHHGVSKLRKNYDFITAETAEFLLSTAHIGPPLNKKLVKSYIRTSSSSLKNEILTKQKNSIISINENIDLISAYLIKNFSINYDIKKMKNTFDVFKNFIESFGG